MLTHHAVPNTCMCLSSVYQFLLLIFVLHRIEDSAGLSMQALIPPFRRIPRAIFTVLAFIIYTVAGVAGRQHFSTILNNFLAVVSPFAISRNPR